MAKALEGQVAIVTGASRGIGRAIAERLGREGAKIVLTYAGNGDQAQEAVRAIESGGSQAMALASDVRDLDQIRSLFETVVERFGAVNILVNNAAGKNIFKPNAEMTPEEYDSMFSITRGVYFMLQEAAKIMPNGGKIVNISTSGTSQAMAGGGAYIGCKAAIEQFSNCLAKELGARGISVNTLAPGLTDTGGVTLDEQTIKAMIAQTPMGRLGQPLDVANAVYLLVSPDAGWVTGQNLRANGGIV